MLTAGAYAPMTRGLSHEPAADLVDVRRRCRCYRICVFDVRQVGTVRLTLAYFPCNIMSRMQLNSDNLLFHFLRWAWVSLIIVIAYIYRKLMGLEAQAQVIATIQDNFVAQRKEDQERHTAERDEMLNKVDRHHELQMRKLEKLESRIKNGK